MSQQPATALDLLGHEQAEKVLLDAYHSGRMHHGWLIIGPAGVGKMTLAYRLARFLLVSGNERPTNTLEISAAHPVFKRVAAGSHRDLMVIERSLNDRGTLRENILVDDVRKIEELFHLTSAEGGARVVIIDQADTMNTAAQNAILKLLEEPPANTFVLLAAESRGRLLPTLRSRVRTIVLQPLSAAVMHTLLNRFLAGDEAVNNDALVALSGGSIGKALHIHQSEVVPLYLELLSLLEDTSGQADAKVLVYADKIAGRQSGESFAFLSRMIVSLLESTAKACAGAQVTLSYQAEESVIRALGARLGLDKTLELWEKIRNLFVEAVSVNLDRKYVMMSVFFALRG